MPLKVFFIHRQEKDSKDEVAKAEKELEEIRKVIEESGGKLSDRVLQCDVRRPSYTRFLSKLANVSWLCALLKRAA